jgi:hypothetical protein
MDSWKYKNKFVNSIEDMPEGVVGFVYEVTHVSTGMKYIGKKILEHRRTLPPLKGYKRKRKVVKESDWKGYYGSSKVVKDILKEQGDCSMSREILFFAKSKKQMSYYENKLLFERGVIEPDSKYYNDNIEGRYFRKDLQEEVKK